MVGLSKCFIVAKDYSYLFVFQQKHFSCVTDNMDLHRLHNLTHLVSRSVVFKTNTNENLHF